MKLSDTVETLLKSKEENRVLSVGPDDSVYEAIEKMALFSVGAMLVIAEKRLVGIVSERDYARKVILMGHSSKGNARQRDHDPPGRLRERATHCG